MCTRIYDIYIIIYVDLCYAKLEFILMSPTLIHCHIDHSSLPSWASNLIPACLPITSPSNSEIPGLYPPPFVYSVVQFQCMWIVASELTCYLCETILSARVQCSVRFLCLWSYRRHCFQNYLGQHFSPTPFMEVVSSICCRVGFMCHLLHSSWDPK